MRIWGYVLIFLNILAAGAFTYYATAVWSKRLDWQYALLKQEIVNRGLPLEASEVVADDIEENSVAFYYKYSNHTIGQISKERLKKYLPSGGKVFGQASGDPVTNQTDEVKRVEKIVFDELGAIKDPLEKRSRMMILLLNLASGSGRPSHVLRAIGLTNAEAKNSIRLGFGRYTTRAEVIAATRAIEAAAAAQGV